MKEKCDPHTAQTLWRYPTLIVHTNAKTNPVSFMLVTNYRFRLKSSCVRSILHDSEMTTAPGVRWRSTFASIESTMTDAISGSPQHDTAFNSLEDSSTFNAVCFGADQRNNPTQFRALYIKQADIDIFLRPFLLEGLMLRSQGGGG